MVSCRASTAPEIDPGEVKRAYGIHRFAPLILFIGRLVYQKGPDLLIEAMKTVMPRPPGCTS